MSDHHGTIPPIMMLRSFLAVGSGYAAHLVALFAATFLVGQFYPEFVEYLQIDDPERQKQLMADEPFQVMPRSMVWITVALVGGVCLVIGALVCWTAPFSPFAHAGFVAVILFVSYLQTSISQSAEQKTLTIIYMVVFPLAILVGGRWAYVNGIVSATRRSSEPGE